MFEEKLSLLKAMLSTVCKTLDSFDDMNMPEHLNEPLCFVSVKSYKTGEMVMESDSKRSYASKARIVVDFLGARNMSAHTLADLVDGKALTAIGSLGFSVYSLERKPCEFSRLHFRHIISLEFDIDVDIPSASLDGVSISIDSTAEPIFNTYELSFGTKIAATPLSNGTMLSNVVCPQPTKLLLKGRISSSQAEAVISHLKGYSAGTHTITVGATKYTDMQLTSLTAKMLSITVTEISTEFSEVNE